MSNDAYDGRVQEACATALVNTAASLARPSRFGVVCLPYPVKEVWSARKESAVMKITLGCDTEGSDEAAGVDGAQPVDWAASANSKRRCRTVRPGVRRSGLGSKEMILIERWG